MNYTKNKRPQKILELNNGKKLVETAGYRTSAQQINELLNAGKRLDEYRKEQYDFQIGEKETPIDPTRNANFDLADASRIAEETNQRLREQEQRIEAGNAEKAKQAKQAEIEAIRAEIIAEQKLELDS